MPAKGAVPVTNGSRDVVVVGGGPIGLAVAWRAAQRGLSATVVDPSPGGGASWIAAGMLAAITEAHYGEERLLALNLDSARRYPAFVAELEGASGVDVGYATAGTLVVAADAGDRAVVADLHAYQRRLGLASELLTGREVRALEPMLAPTVRGGLLVASDHSVNPRRLTEALRVAAERLDVTIVAERATEAGAKTVRLADGSTLAAGEVVVAAGAWSPALTGLPGRPVKGHVVRLRGQGFLRHTIRGVVAGSQVYVVPRADGEVVIGATMEELGFDTTVRAGGVYELLRDARAILPGITELEFVEAGAGLRPGSPDNAPIIGRLADGRIVATGHYRNGILLTPVTADAIADLLGNGSLPAGMEPFTPDRLAVPRPPSRAPVGSGV
ncbi:MAG: glycine oxidase ThiO [Frankiaceae bacterium]